MKYDVSGTFLGRPLIRTQFLTAFHRNSKLVLSEEVYEQIVKMQKTA